MRGRVAGLLGLAGLFSCASSWGDAALTADAEDHVVVTLRARDGELTLTSTARGVRYSVRDVQGGIQPSLTLDELQALEPHLYELVRRATASAALGSPAKRGGGQGAAYEGAVLDASLIGLPVASPPASGSSLNASRK